MQVKFKDESWLSNKREAPTTAAYLHATPAERGFGSRKRRCPGLERSSQASKKAFKSHHGAALSAAGKSRDFLLPRVAAAAKQWPPQEAEEALWNSLNVNSSQELKDLLNCLLLSETSYKVVDMGRKRATEMLNRIRNSFPEGSISIERVQWSQPSVFHRYMLAEDHQTLYVAFIGTKQRRDLVANAAVLQVPFWPDPSDKLAAAAVHRGFSSRARTVPIEGLFALACQKRKRLVLTGHSLGGAVAQLCTLRLLNQLPKGSKPALRCMTFACPAVGNPSLSSYVQASGWVPFFQNLLIPEDVVPRLLASPKQSPEQVAAAAIAALDTETQRFGDDDMEFVMGVFEAFYTAEGSSQGVEKSDRGSDQGLQSGQQRKGDPQTLDDLPKDRVTKALDNSQQSSMEPPAVVTGNSEVREQEWLPEGPASSTYDEDLAESDLEEELDSDNEDAAMVLELIREEEASTAHLEEVQGNSVASTPSGSATTDGAKGVHGRQRLGVNQEIFFPWSSRPLPSFAREMAGKALRKAVSMKLRKISFPYPKPMSPDGPTLPREEVPQAKAGSAVAFQEASPRTLQSMTADTEADGSASLSSISMSSYDDENGSGRTIVPQTLTSRVRRLGDKQVIGRLGANVGKAATGAAKGAARIVSTPLRVAQRNYAVVGRQAFLSSAGVLQADQDEADKTFAEGLEGASQCSRLSALASLGEQNATPSTIVSLQLPIAAARRKQPFLMHKMAFHRARVLSLIECSMAATSVSGSQLPPQLPGSRPQLSRAQRPVELSNSIAPQLKPHRAEVFLPYSLPDDADMKVIMDDLGSLSALPPMTSAVRQSNDSGRFQWLKPWQWISGLGWRGGKNRATVELTAQVRGSGLEHCSSVQVLQAETNRWCNSEIIFRPLPPLPSEVYSQLGPHRKGYQRRGAEIVQQAKTMGRRLMGFLDRTNAMGSPDCLLVKIYMPVEAMQDMEKCLLQQAGDSSGLILQLTSDFHKVQVPLQVHGGGSWLVSDIRSSSRVFNDYLNRSSMS